VGTDFPSITIPPWGWLVAGGLVGGGSGFTLNQGPLNQAPQHDCEAIAGSLSQCDVALKQMVRIVGECTSRDED